MGRVGRASDTWHGVTCGGGRGNKEAQGGSKMGPQGERVVKENVE